MHIYREFFFSTSDEKKKKNLNKKNSCMYKRVYLFNVSFGPSLYNETLF